LLGPSQDRPGSPRVFAYALADSPVGLAAYLFDHDERSYKLIARAFDGQEGA
jgi:hypothetical protein